MLRRTAKKLWLALIRMFGFIGKEVRTIWHQPRLVFSLILGPFFILLLFGVGYRNVPRTLTSLFVVDQQSVMATQIEANLDLLGSRIEYAGMTEDADEADLRLRQRDVDVVVVVPPNPNEQWDADEPSTFSVYHNEIDPVEETYVQIIGQRYTEEINKQILYTAIADMQQQAGAKHVDISRAKQHATAVRESISAGEQAEAQASATALNAEVDLMKVALGGSAALMLGLSEANGSSDAATHLLERLNTLSTKTNAMVEDTGRDSTYQDSLATVGEVEALLDEIDALLLAFEERDTAVLVAPFRSESLSISRLRIEPMHFYVPAVIALLLQHLAITLASMSIIRERLGGAMELFRAAPISALEMLFGKYASYLGLIAVMAAALTALIVVGLGVPQIGSWSNYVLVLAAVLLAALGIGFHISLSANSDSQAIQYGMLTLLAAIFFSGFFLPLYRLVPVVRIVSWLLPATYGTTMLQDVMLRGQAPNPLLMLGLLAFAAVLFLLAWLRLRWQMARE